MVFDYTFLEATGLLKMFFFLIHLSLKYASSDKRRPLRCESLLLFTLSVNVIFTNKLYGLLFRYIEDVVLVSICSLVS